MQRWEGNWTKNLVLNDYSNPKESILFDVFFFLKTNHLPGQYHETFF